MTIIKTDYFEDISAANNYPQQLVKDKYTDFQQQLFDYSINQSELSNSIEVKGLQNISYMNL